MSTSEPVHLMHHGDTSNLGLSNLHDKTEKKLSASVRVLGDDDVGLNVLRCGADILGTQMRPCHTEDSFIRPWF